MCYMFCHSFDCQLFFIVLRLYLKLFFPLKIGSAEVLPAPGEQRIPHQNEGDRRGLPVRRNQTYLILHLGCARGLPGIGT